MANVYWQSVPQPDCTWKDGLTVCACIALNLHISRFESSGADGNWFKVGCSRHGDETISDSVQHRNMSRITFKIKRALVLFIIFCLFLEFQLTSTLFVADNQSLLGIKR